MKFFVALCILGFSVALYAQTDLRTFTSPDGVFRFRYSRELVRCTPQQTDHDFSGDACLACDDPPALAITIACVAYPKDAFKDKPTFVAAGFFVAEVRDVATKDACLAGSQNWNSESAESTRISGVNFKVYQISDWGLGNGRLGHIYRTFHDRMCYELGIQEAHTSPGAYDPGTIKEFTKQDQNEVHGRLKQALDSFRFLK